eukprot:4813902-Amphidinium_carterae.1
MWILEAPPRVVMVGRKRHVAVCTDASVEYPNGVQQVCVGGVLSVVDNGSKHLEFFAERIPVETVREWSQQG